MSSWLPALRREFTTRAIRAMQRQNVYEADMLNRREICALGGAAALSACARPIAQRPSGMIDGKPVTMLLVYKQRRRLFVMSGDEVLRSYHAELGFTPTGHKQFEGDGRTPEGTYRIDRRNPQSEYYLSLGISYPNRNDAARAHAQGKSPGGDIFIHGTTRPFQGKRDWTAGCIAVSNRVMRELFAAIRVGTVIHIAP